jgi:hypothetical protein
MPPPPPGPRISASSSIDHAPPAITQPPLAPWSELPAEDPATRCEPRPALPPGRSITRPPLPLHGATQSGVRNRQRTEPRAERTKIQRQKREFWASAIPFTLRIPRIPIRRSGWMVAQPTSLFVASPAPASGGRRSAAGASARARCRDLPHVRGRVRVHGRVRVRGQVCVRVRGQVCVRVGGQVCVRGPVRARRTRGDVCGGRVPAGRRRRPRDPLRPPSGPAGNGRRWNEALRR